MTHYGKIRINIILLLILIVFFISCGNKIKQPVLAEKGVIDLTNLNFETEGNVILDGEWEFYWKKLYTSESFRNNKHIPDTIVNCPSLWNNYEINGEKLPGQGFATYRLTVKTKPEVVRLAIRTTSQLTAFKLFVNGKLLIQNGTVSGKPEEMIAQYRPQVAFFNTKKTENEIILQISNNHHQKGGFRRSLLLGSQENILAERDFYFARDAFLAGLLLLMCLYSFGLYFFRRKDSASLYFSILTLLFFLRTIDTSEYLLVYFFPETIWRAQHLIEYFTFFLIPIPFLLFISKLFPGAANKKINYIFIFLCTFYSIIALIGNSFFNSKLLPSFNLVVGSLLIYGIIILIRAKRRKQQGAIILIIGFSVLGLTVVNDILFIQQIVITRELFALGFFVFIITQAFALSLHVFQAEKDKFDLEHTVSTVNMLSEISKQITSGLKVENIIKTVYQQVNKLMDVAIFDVGIYNPSSGSLDFQGGIKHGEKLPFSSEALSKQNSLSVYCFKRREQVIINDFKKDYNKYMPEMTAPKGRNLPKSVIYLPLEVKENIIGVITVQSFTKNVYTNYHLDIMHNITSHTAIALDNASAYKQIEKQNLQLELQKEKIQTSAEELKKANSTKDRIFSIIAHDLKSPFNTMLGFSKLLVNKFEEYDVEEQKKFIGFLNHDIKNTYKLLENLLLWSSTQRGTIDFKPGKENLYSLSGETIELLSQLALNKSLTLINKIPEDIYVKVDKNMMLTIFRNLISNAIKFTPKGGDVTINARVLTNDDKQKYTEISVKDSGVGIVKEKWANIFELSDNISTKGTEGEQGTGLGLMLCKEFVEKHSGKIWVESEVGKGSKFIFTLPQT